MTSQKHISVSAACGGGLVLHVLDAKTSAGYQEQELAMSTTAHKVATQVGKTKGKRPPSVVREIIYGMSLGLFAGYLWKLHHWSNQRRTREFYSLLDQGRITVVVDEPSPGAED